jgi:hypothetical protein
LKRVGSYAAAFIILVCAMVIYYVVATFTAFTQPYFIVYLAGILVVMVISKN